jgi:hypothetical protein
LYICIDNAAARLLAGSSEVAHDSFKTGLAIAVPNGLESVSKSLDLMSLYCNHPKMLRLHTNTSRPAA